MNYSDLIHKLFQTNLFSGKKQGLDNCHALDQLFHYPHRLFNSIHIAGTNGKGSVATKIASGLQAAGYRVGLYTSPHISCFRERICINGEKIPQKDAEELLSELFETVQQNSIPATFFELTTYLAFLYFSREKIDFAVLETGLGGRFDATNVVNPILSVITSISLDHTEILGNSVESIAFEKAGIIKPKIPVIIGPRVPYGVIKEVADSLKSPCQVVEASGNTFEYENTAIAIQALKYLSTLINLPESAIAQALVAKPTCRLEIVCSDPTIILDVAHNPDGLDQLFKAIAYHYPHQKVGVLFGLSKSKDLSSCLAILARQGHFFYPIEAENGRGVPVEMLCHALQNLGVDPDCLFNYPNVFESLKKAKEDAKVRGHLLIGCGTFFIMDEVKKALELIKNNRN